MARPFILLAVIATLPFTIASGVLAQSVSEAPATAAVEVTVWRRISDPSLLYVSTRPEGGSWRTLNTALDMSMESRSGRFHQSNAVHVEVPLGGGAAANVEVTVWRRISDPSLLYVSTRPEGGTWRTLNTSLDMSMESRSGRFHQSNAVLVEVPLPSTTFTGAFDEVEYTVVLEPGWYLLTEEEGAHYYQRYDPLTVVIAQPFGPVQDTLPQYAEWVGDGREWELARAVPAYSLFEFLSLEAVTVGGQVVYELRYRFQSAPDQCVISGVERIGAVTVRNGLTAGIRLQSWVCEGDALAFRQARQAILDSLQIGARPSE